MSDHSEAPMFRLTAEATFILQLRSDSNIDERRLSGRVEHMMSGESEPFASLDALLEFLKRFSAPNLRND